MKITIMNTMEIIQKFLKSDEHLINKTKTEESLADFLMSPNFPIKTIKYVISTIISCDQKMIKLGEKPTKYKWEYCDVILLLTLLGVNNCLPLLYTSKTFIYMKIIGKGMNQFAIGYMVNPALNVTRRSEAKSKMLEFSSFGYAVWYLKYDKEGK